MEQSNVESNLKPTVNVLSARELHELGIGSQRNPSVLQRGGVKEYAPDGSWLQARRLQKAYQERKTVLAEEKAARVDLLATGIWNSKIGLVVVKECKNQKCLQHVGYNKGLDVYLYPEEALYLMAIQDLVLTFENGFPVSEERAVAMFSQSSTFQVELWQVYMHLSRLGYSLQRNKDGSTASEYERLIKLDETILERYKRKFPEIYDIVEPVDDQVIKRSKSDKNDAESDENQVRSKCTIHNNTDIHNNDSDSISTSAKCMDLDSNIVEENTGQVLVEQSRRADIYNATNGENHVRDIQLSINSVKNDLTAVEQTTICQDNNVSKSTSPQIISNLSCIAFPDIASVDSDELVLNAPAFDLLPPGVQLNKTEYCVNLKHIRNDCGRTKSSRIQYDDELKFSFPEMPTGIPTLKVTSWKEYKQVLSKTIKDDALLTSPVGVLWEGDVKPLIRPSCLDTESMLKKLQVIDNVHVRKENSCPSETQVVFDVFHPDSKFKKTCPGVPAQRLIVTRFTAKPPSLSDICAISSQYKDDVPMTWAVVDNGDITFYRYLDVCLPTEL